MKNIHVIATDKPSRLSDCHNNKLHLDDVRYLRNYQNIYITNSEDINENDYIITKDGRLVQVSYLLSKDLEGASKVVLATDIDLIKEGIQAIDDEFLEWFVKNPSCEEVEVVKQELNTDYRSDWKQKFYYKIIIPKDELIQERRYSEEEVLVLLHKRDKYSMDKSLTFSYWQTPKEWFEQFKKK